MRITHLCFLGLLFCFRLHAQPDTASFRLGQIVEITDSLNARLLHRSDYTRFERDSLGFYVSTGVTVDALLRQAEGLYLRNYGGHGGVKTLSVRGFSTQQTTVSINGIPYRNPQTDVVNFGNFFPDGYASVSVFRSASGASQNPLGGNIAFEISPEKTGIRAKLGAGSFGERQAALSASFRKHRTALRASYHFLEAQDNYPFSLNGESGIREHAAYQTQQYQFYIDQELGKGYLLSYLASGFFNRQEIPGAVVTGSPVNEDGELSEDDHYYFVQLEKQTQNINNWRPFRLRFSTSYHYNYLGYDWDNRLQQYTNHDLLAQVESEHLGRRQRFSANLQYNPSWLSGNNLAINFTPVPSVQRQQLNLGFHHQYYLPLDTLGRQLTFETTLRGNYLEAYGFLPNAGLNTTYRTRSKKTEYFTHLHFGHRVPSFNELYYFGYGNADLDPEKVYSADLGGWWHLHLGIPFSLKADVFYNQTLNKIIAIPINPARWSTLAIGKSRSYGFELSLEALLGKHSTLYATYTRQQAQDLTRSDAPYLPYTPPEVASYGMKTEFGRVGFQVHGTYSGWRFSLLENGASSYLPPYHLLDASLSYTAHLGDLTYRLLVEVENLAGVNYEVIKSYPMPPRSLRVVLVMRYE